MPSTQRKHPACLAHDPGGLPAWGWALRRVLAHAFRCVSRSVFRVKVRGLDHFTNAPATLIVANHQSDYDTLVLLPSLYRAHHGRGPIGRVRFVAAEPMFQPAYVAMYLIRRWPLLARRLLYPANLSSVLKGLGAYPIPSGADRKLNLHLRALFDRFGDQPLGELLEAPVSELFPDAPEELTINQALDFRWRDALDQRFHLDRFKSSWAHAAKALYLRDAQQSLDHFAGALARGDDVFIAPEGTLESDGQFLPVKAGVARLAQQAGRPVTFLPAKITYELMTTARPTAFVAVGQQHQDIDQMPRHEMENLTARSIVVLNTITLPQLAADALADTLESRSCTVDEQEFSAGLFDQARALHLRNLAVDDCLLQDQSFRRRWRRFIDWCLGHGFASRVDRDRLRFERESPIAGEQASPGRQARWRFAANELRSAVQAVAPDRTVAADVTLA